MLPINVRHILTQKQKNKSISLNYDAYKNQKDNDKKFLDKFSGMKDYKNNFEFEFLQNNESSIENSKENIERRDQWKKVLLSDFHLNEGLKVLENLKSTMPKKSIAVN